MVWRARKRKEGKLYAGLFADGGLSAGESLSQVSREEKKMCKVDAEVPSMSPELEAALEEFGRTKLEGHPQI
jgi:hypothetical protein